MKGFVPTPDALVDLMVARLFAGGPPSSRSALLDPGCGEGAFIAGVLRWCAASGRTPPRIVGVEGDAMRAQAAAIRFRGAQNVEIRVADFLRPSGERFDYVIGNPPYVPLTALTVEERAAYRGEYTVARGRFDLYLLFFEQAVRMLAPGGRLVFVTPEKYLYVDTARPLRELMLGLSIEELRFVSERAFGALVTYPLVTTLEAREAHAETRVIHRDGSERAFRLHSATSWLPVLLGHRRDRATTVLGDVCIRASCGVATGADDVFVLPESDLSPGLAPFAHRTVAGRDIAEGELVEPRHVMLVPYDGKGELLPESALSALGDYLRAAPRRQKLLRRTCVARKPWYAFHETPPMPLLLQPKLLCKDITAAPFFVTDRSGRLIPRHSTYYIVPKDPEALDDLSAYLNSAQARDWLRAHCQRAANGFLRLQSHVLRRLPVPASLVPRSEATVLRLAQDALSA